MGEMITNEMQQRLISNEDEFSGKFKPGTLCVDRQSIAVLYMKDMKLYICIWKNMNQNTTNLLDPKDGYLLYVGFESDEEEYKFENLNIKEYYNEMGVYVYLSIVACSKNLIRKWILNDDNISFYEMKSKNRLNSICNICIHRNGLFIATIEGCFIIIRNQTLGIIFEYYIETLSLNSICYLSFMDMNSECLLISIDATLYLIYFINTVMTTSKNNIITYTNNKQNNSIITYLTANEEMCIVGYSNGKVTNLKVILEPILSFIEINFFDISKQIRYIKDVSETTVMQHDDDPLYITYLPNILLSKSIVIILITSGYIFHIDSVTFKCIFIKPLLTILPERSMPIQSIYAVHPNEMTSNCAYHIVHSSAFNQVIYYTTVTSLLPTDLQLSRNSMTTVIEGNSNDNSLISSLKHVNSLDNTPTLSYFISIEAISTSSILNNQLIPPPTPDKFKGAARAKIIGEWETPRTLNGKLIDQPVTFHSNIKSSGYGKSERDLWNNNKRKSKVTAIKRSNSASAVSTNSSSTIVGVRIRNYDISCEPTTQYQKGNEISPISVPYFKVNYNSDGSAITMATSQSTVFTYKLPIYKYKGDGINYMGHNNRITNTSFSNDKSMILSSSSDGTVRIWKERVDTPVVIFSHYLRQPTNTSSMASKINTQIQSNISRNKPYATEIKHSSFFFQDKFVMIAVKNNLLLYSYEIAIKSKNDLKRQQELGKYNQIYNCQHEGSMQITTASCMNTIQSPLIFSTTSDKRFFIIDASIGQTVRTLDSPHERAIHCIALPSPTIYTQLSSDIYNIWATSAIDNNIILWDLRTTNIISRFTNHLNRREEIGCAFSPCMKYLATGSEDRSTRIIDLRMCRELSRLQGHKDVVSDVAYNPLFSQLATCSFDGTVRFYADPGAKEGQYEFM